jgi:hypothetical protein
MLGAVLLWSLLASSAGVGAENTGAPQFALPIDCQIGKTCIVQNYVDHEPGPAARDYRCGWLTYDGHKGTDIRIPDRSLFERGVLVLAAASGRVRALRDGMPDVNVRTAGKAAVAGKEAGNSVVIDHGAGWESQYAHLRKGSVSVRTGDAIKAGDRLGLVGMSGNTEFPHLHFEVRHRGQTVDPFVGLDRAEPCKAGAGTLWQAQLIDALAYVTTGVLDAGIAGAPPVLGDGSVDRGKTQNFGSASAAAIFWVQIYGAQESDREELRLLAPGGRIIAERSARVSRNQAQRLAYVGVRRRGAGWPAGRYSGEYALYRGQQKLIALERDLDVADR